MNTINMTQKKYDELNAELLRRKTIEREKISKDIKTAKEFGDLSENAEYKAAKDAQVANDMEIARLEEIVALANVIDESAINTDVVSIGTTVTLYDLEFDEEIVYTIVSSIESDVINNKISERSPIGKALLGHKKGETIKAKTPTGEMLFKIISIDK